MKVFKLLIILSLVFCTCEKQVQKDIKILYINSYQEAYEPNIKTRAAFENKLLIDNYKIEYKYLNSKVIKDENTLRKISQDIKSFADSWQPDIIIAADDAANKYVISKYYLESTIPVVFIGVNWDANKYGYPTENITGQIEVDQLSELLRELKKYTSGSKIGILTGDTFTDKINIEYYRNNFGINFDKISLVDNYNDWRKSYIELQDEVDILILRHNGGILDWDTREAIKTVNEHNKIPTGSISESMMNYVHITLSKQNTEYGEYAAKTAVKILNGASPSSIPLTTNFKSDSVINTSINENVSFDKVLYNKSQKITNTKKIYFINSYHSGYAWSDGVEYGLLKSLRAKTNYLLDLKIYRMNTKLNQDVEYIRDQAAKVVSEISLYKPDVIISADDNAAKYVIEPYYKNGPIPTIFCGLNWDASIYGFPTEYVTGMVEIAPVQSLINELSKHSNGTKLGYLGSNTYSETKEIDHYKRQLGIDFYNGYHVNTIEDYKRRFVELQVTVDILILINVTGIEGWKNKDHYDFIKENTLIPSGTTSQNVNDLAAISFVRIPEEQGEWAGEQAINYLNGVPFRNIKITTNKKSEITINKTLVDRLNLRLDKDLLETASVFTYK